HHTPTLSLHDALPISAIERGREPTLRVSQWNEDLLARAAGLADASERLFELVLAELDLERADHRHGNHSGAGQHLLRVHERREVDRKSTRLNSSHRTI